MQIVRWDPFGMRREFDRLMETETSERAWVPRIDAFETEGDLKIRVEVPGVPTEDIDVTVENGSLTISGSRSFESIDDKPGYHRKELFEGTFKRTFFLPDRADVDAVAAEAKDGILEITVPAKAEALPKKVSVEVS